MTGIDEATPRPWRHDAEIGVIYDATGCCIGSIIGGAVVVRIVNSSYERDQLLREAENLFDDALDDMGDKGYCVCGQVKDEMVGILDRIRTALGESGEKK